MHRNKKPQAFEQKLGDHTVVISTSNYYWPYVTELKAAHSVGPCVDLPIPTMALAIWRKEIPSSTL